MKCIQCGTDNKLRDRTANQGRCKNCNHQFAFEPTTKNDLKLSDPLFAKVLVDISANNTLFFTFKQFVYLLDRRLKTRFSLFGSNWVVSYIFFNWGLLIFFNIFSASFLKSWSFIIVPVIVNLFYIVIFFNRSNSSKVNYQARKASARNLQILGAFILGVGIFFSLQFNFFIIFVISVLLGMLSIYLGTKQRIRQTLITETYLFEKTQFQDWVNRWIQVNGAIANILAAPQEQRTLTAVSPDVSAYSFDRVLVCDQADVAQFLIANNFHFENNCAILSVTGYPQNIFATVMQMLRRNSDLKVYALHDTSPSGVQLVHTLRTSSNWFQNSNVTIYDLGILPRQILKNPNVFTQASDESAVQAKQLLTEVRQELTKEEIEWLEAGKFVELESFTPKKLLQIVTQGIAKSRTPDFTDSLVPIDSGGSDIYIFAADSFG